MRADALSIKETVDALARGVLRAAVGLPELGGDARQRDGGGVPVAIVLGGIGRLVTDAMRIKCTGVSAARDALACDAVHANVS